MCLQCGVITFYTYVILYVSYIIKKTFGGGGSKTEIIYKTPKNSENCQNFYSTYIWTVCVMRNTKY